MAPVLSLASDAGSSHLYQAKSAMLQVAACVILMTKRTGQKRNDWADPLVLQLSEGMRTGAIQVHDWQEESLIAMEIFAAAVTTFV